MDVTLFNRQRSVPLPLDRLRLLATAVPAACFSLPGPMPSVLEQAVGVEISLVSDRAIARVHRQFLGISGATDVITFPHGEIVISAFTARKQAEAHGESTTRELARYIVHGFLHLHGHIDLDPADAARMWRAQEQILDSLWPRES